MLRWEGKLLEEIYMEGAKTLHIYPKPEDFVNSRQIPRIPELSKPSPRPTFHPQAIRNVPAKDGKKRLKEGLRSADFGPPGRPTPPIMVAVFNFFSPTTSPWYK